MRIDENVMQAVLLDWVMEEKKHQMAVPNITVIFPWEADLLSVTKAGLCHEFEIKLNRDDYNRDFLKKKHKCGALSEAYQGTNDYKWGVPNYFWYVTHSFGIQPPTYAGWITVDWERKRGGGQVLVCRVQREAPRIHATKIIGPRHQETIVRGMAYRLKNVYRAAYLHSLYKETNEQSK